MAGGPASVILLPQQHHRDTQDQADTKKWRGHTRLGARWSGYVFSPQHGQASLGIHSSHIDMRSE
jgi:hypothetical protein